jgi:hypothetical protein
VHEIVWEFQPAPRRERDFESVYGPTGLWVELFRRDPGYLGSELIPPREPGGWYRTIDRWESVAAYERFREAWGRIRDARPGMRAAHGNGAGDQRRRGR